jgi:hypothetical protein
MKATFCLIYLTIIFLPSCRGKNNVKDVQVIFNNEIFDKEIIKNFNLYDSLKNIFVLNIDTIFKYRDETKQNEKASVNTLSYRFDYPLAYKNNDDEISFSTIPKFLFNRIDTIFKKLSADKIVAIDVIKNPLSVEIILKNKRDDKTYVETQHTLTWNWDYRNQHLPFTKDTLIAPHWIYYINCEKDQDLW